MRASWTVAMSALTTFAVVLLLAGPAGAGYIQGDSRRLTIALHSLDNTYTYCGRGYATVGDSASPADGQAFVRATFWFPGSCGSTNGDYVMTAGKLGAFVVYMRNGTVCGSTNPVFSSVATARFGVGAVVCSNPAGGQVWNTYGSDLIWRPQANDYELGNTYTTPSQTY